MYSEEVAPHKIFMNISIDDIIADLSDVRQERVDDIIGSIQEIGLLHPITVQPATDGKYNLVAGKVRLKAYIQLKRTEIPVEITASKVSTVEISIQENLRRANLEWWEQIELEQKLHDLRIAQHGKRRTGRGAPKTGGWSQQDTADELGIALGAMSQDLFLANAIRENPHLKNIKDKITAFKIAKETARRVNAETEALLPANFTMNQVFCGESFEILKEIPDQTFNFCLTDPPWLEYKDDSLTRDEFTLPVFEQVYRVLSRDSLLYAFVSTPDFIFYREELKKFKFVVQDYPMIWHKPSFLTYGRRSWESSRNYELIIVAAKGVPTLSSGIEQSSILTYPIVSSVKLIHPNEKPLDLLKELISRATFSEAKILDPFAGSGAVLEAARSMHRQYIGIERNHKFYEKIQRRLQLREAEKSSQLAESEESSTT